MHVVKKITLSLLLSNERFKTVLHVVVKQKEEIFQKVPK